MPQRFGLYEDLTVQREPEPLCRPARRDRRGARSEAFERLLAFTDLARVHRPAGRQAVGRHEAEARPGLRPDPHAAAAAARRAERRRRSDLAPRAVADGLRPGRPGHRRRLEHGLSRRGRALRRGAAAQRRPGALRRPAQGADRPRRGPQLPGRGRRAKPARGAGRGAAAARGHRRRDPGQQRPPGDRPRARSRPTPATLGVAGGRRSRRRRRASRMPSSTCWAAARRASRRWPVGAAPAPMRRDDGRRGRRADQAVRRLHGRRPDHASASAAARSSACSGPTAPASRPRSR